MVGISLSAFADELLKIAVKLPVLHGTSGAWDVLKPGVGGTVLRNDPNPRAVYVALKNRDRSRALTQFARESVKAKGGTPMLAHAKVDSKKGWGPSGLTVWGKNNIGTTDKAKDLVDELDAGAVEPRRGTIWKTLQKGTGSWTNEDPATTLKPRSYKNVG